MKPLSSRAASLQPSPTLALDAQLKQMIVDGQEVANLCVGEPDFAAPDGACEKVIEAVRAGKSRYTDVAGIPELRRRIVRKLEEENGLSYEPGQIVVSTGGKHALFNAFYALCNAGDEVLVPSPYWVSYPEQIRAVDAVAVIVEATEETEFKVTVEQLARHTTPRTKALVMNSPNNPSGATYTGAELASIGEFAVEHDLYVVEDIIYEHFYYDDRERFRSIASVCPEVKDRTVVINGLSKACAMTGWRIGYSASTVPIAALMKRLQSQVTSNATSIAQYGAIGALDDVPWGAIAEFRGRRDYIHQQLVEIDGISCVLPTGAFYVFPSVSGLLGRSFQGTVIEDSDAFCSLLLKEHLVGGVPGGVFGSPENIRLSYAVSRRDLERAADGIRQLASQLT